MPASTGVRLLDGDYAAAWSRVADALRRVPGLEVDGAQREAGVLRGSRRRFLGREHVVVRLEEIETGEVEVRVEATGSGVRAAPDETVAAVLQALPPR